VQALYWILILVMLVGVAGAAIPALPGASLILGAVLVWGFATQFAGIGVALTVAIVVLLLSLGIEYLAVYFGTKQVGASNWSQIGAIVGMVLGFFGFLPALPLGGPLIGLLLGPTAGAFLGEFFYRRELAMTPRLKQSLRACIGVVVGTFVGTILEVLLALIAVIVFVTTTWSQYTAL
jgi:hypothetical protein